MATPGILGGHAHRWARILQPLIPMRPEAGQPGRAGSNGGVEVACHLSFLHHRIGSDGEVVAGTAGHLSCVPSGTTSAKTSSTGPRCRGGTAWSEGQVATARNEPRRKVFATAPLQYWEETGVIDQQSTRVEGSSALRDARVSMSLLMLHLVAGGAAPAVAFTPTPQEACCQAILDGSDTSICGGELPSEDECRNILEDMGSAAARQRNHTDEPSARERRTEEQERKIDASGPTLVACAGIIISLLLVIVAAKFFDRRKVREYLAGVLFFLNSAVLVVAALYGLIALLCGIGNSCATTNLFLVYVVISIPAGVALLSVVFAKYLRAEHKARMSAWVLILNGILLTTIIGFRIGTSG